MYLFNDILILLSLRADIKMVTLAVQHMILSYC
jgi:hypothetical protein